MNKILIAALGAVATQAYKAELKFLGSEEETGAAIVYHESPQTLSSSTACQFYSDFSWYSFIDTENLSSSQYFESSSTGVHTATAYFTYCQDLSNTEAPACANSAYYASIEDKNGNCVLNTTSISGMTRTEDDNTSQFYLDYQNTDSSTNGGVEHLYVAQNCTTDMKTVKTGALTFDGSSYWTSQESDYACPILTKNALIQFIDQYAWAFGTAFIIMGLFLAFLGRKLFNAAVFIVSTLVVCGLILFVFYATFLQDNTEAWVGWTVLGVSALLGLLAGYLMVKMEKIAGAALAGWGGFCVGVLLNETVLYLVGSEILFWCVNIGLALIFALLGYCIFDQSVIIATSFIGSYLSMRGIGIMAGGFPNEYALLNDIEAGTFDNIDPVFYAYLAGIVVLTILSSIVQFKMFNAQRQADAHPYAKLN